MPRTTLIAFVMLAASTASAGSGSPPPRDYGRLSPEAASFTGPALHRDALLGEVARGERPLFGHDPRVKSPEHPRNQFLIVRDKYVSPGSEHALGIFTPPDRDQPAHIREVPRSEAPHLGRMIRTLLFADRSPASARPGGFANWDLYVNMWPAVPRLHVHAQPGGTTSQKIADWNAFAEQRGYTLVKRTKSLNVWQWTKRVSAPEGWSVLAVGDAALGAPASFDGIEAKHAAAVDRVIGNAWLEAAALTRGGQVEASRNDSQIVARGN